MSETSSLIIVSSFSRLPIHTVGASQADDRAFIVGDVANATMIIRALGPSLAPAGEHLLSDQS